MNRKLFFASVLLLAAPAFVLAATAQDKGYLLYSCNAQCRVDYGDASYEDLQKCAAKCVATGGSHLMVAPSDIRNRCAGGGEPLTSAQASLCKAIRSGRDTLEATLNQSNPNACPAGATLSADGSACLCPGSDEKPPRTELDNLHTVCLNPANIKENLRNIFAMLPDDTQQAIADKIGNEAKSVANGFGEFAGEIASDLARAYAKELFAQYVYTNVFRDTANLRKLIRQLGRDGIKTLIGKMLTDAGAGLHNVNATSPTKAPAPPTPSPSVTPSTSQKLKSHNEWLNHFSLCYSECNYNGENTFALAHGMRNYNIPDTSRISPSDITAIHNKCDAQCHAQYPEPQL